MIKTTTITNTAERKIFIALFISVVFSMFSYIYFIGIMSVSAAGMSEIGKEIREKSTSLSGMEEEYMTLTKDITLSYAYSLGFKESKGVIYAARKTFAINFGNEKK